MPQTLNSFIKMKKCASPLQPHTAVHLKYLTAARQLSFSIQKPPLYTRTAPNLFLTKTTKLTSHGTSRYPASPSYSIRSPTATYTRRNQRAFWKTLEVRSSRSPIITSSSFCRINLLSSTNLFRAKLRQVRQVRVFSRSVCSRGLAGVRKGGRVWACFNNCLLAADGVSFFRFFPDVFSSKYDKRKLFHSSNHREV